MPGTKDAQWSVEVLPWGRLGDQLASAALIEYLIWAVGTEPRSVKWRSWAPSDLQIAELVNWRGSAAKVDWMRAVGAIKTRMPIEQHATSTVLRVVTSAGLRWDRARNAVRRSVFVGNDSVPHEPTKPVRGRRQMIINVSTLDLDVALKGAQLLGRPRIRLESQELRDWTSLAEKPTSVCVHVRRGDFVTEAAVRSSRGVLSHDYWRRALKAATERVDEQSGRIRIIVFSDDPAAAMNIVRDAVGSTALVSAAPDRSPAWHFSVLSSASNLVIANSGFSWWAAILGEVHRGTTVFAPDEGAPGHPGKLSPHWVPVRADWEP